MKSHKCPWCLGSPLYETYHDTEWGVPIKDDAVFFEFLILESFQAGLSWITILKKREHFRSSFDNFEYHKIANYDEKKIDSLLNDSGIIRHKLKITAAINNAQAFLKVQEDFGSFLNWGWPRAAGKPIKSAYTSYKDAPATTIASIALSKDLKKRGFKFMGPTTTYAFMQATGLVNDHEVDCFRYTEV